MPLGLVAPACSSKAARDLWAVCPIAATDPSVDPRLAELRHVYGRLVRYNGALARDLDLSSAGEAALATYHAELVLLLDVERERRRLEEEERRERERGQR